MSTANTDPHTLSQVIDQRLDAIDGALLGLLPRNDRHTLVADIETRLRNRTCSDTPIDARSLPAVCAPTPSVSPTAASPVGIGGGAQRPPTGRKKSRLAISAGVLGIVSLVLLFLVPVTYFSFTFIGDSLDEIVLLSLLGSHVVAVAAGGIAAVSLAVVALIRISRGRESLAGQGWAIAGLCTGPLPMFIGGMAVLAGCLQLLAARGITTSVQSASTYEAPGQVMPASLGATPASPYNTDPMLPPGSFGPGPIGTAATTPPGPGPYQPPVNAVESESPHGQLPPSAADGDSAAPTLAPGTSAVEPQLPPKAESVSLPVPTEP
jgi:hypothetical protein